MLLSRILSTFTVALCALFLAACSGGKPESTVETFYKAAAKSDVEAAVKQISFAGVPAGQMVQAKGKIQMMVGEFARQVEANDGLASVEVLSSTVGEGGKTAVVQVRVKFKNGKEITETHNLVQEDGDWKLKL